MAIKAEVGMKECRCVHRMAFKPPLDAFIVGLCFSRFYTHGRFQA